MYKIDILKNLEWIYFGESEDINEIDRAVFKLTMLRPNKCMRILENNNLICFLNGTEEQYWYWKNKYVRKKGNNFDYVASFYEHQKKKLKKKEEL